MQGRKPLAAETLALEKSKLYGDQKERAENEPRAIEAIEPVCPPWFRPSEKEAWEYLSEILKNRGIFLDVNGPLLELGAINMAEVRNCQTQILAHGRGSYDNRNPAIRERNKASEILIRILAELNISTTGMARLGSLVARSKKKGNQMEELLD